ncbi:MAG TPA: hypothetical protein VK988_09130 [Acidimicrobiales bacterium]|nr:hypothetical protein [Acidimicrobiales bacterium]
MPRSYAPQFRAMVIEQVRSGRTVAEVAATLELPGARCSGGFDRKDRPRRAGRHPTVESAQLRAAKRRIAELESELATVKRATELFEKGRVVRPKDLFAIVECLASEGHGPRGSAGCSASPPRGSSGVRCRPARGRFAGPGC